MSRNFSCVRAARWGMTAVLLCVASSVSAQGLKYLNVAGTSFRPRDSAVDTVYGGAGCISRGSGVTVFVYALQLPHRSRIRSVRAYFYDTSAKDMTFMLSRHGGEGTTLDDVTFASNSDLGYGMRQSSGLDLTVDNVSYATELSVFFADASSSLEFCGIRVTYIDDTIFVDAFGG